MKIIRLTEDNIDEIVTEAANILRAGGVLLYPTDTLYGLGADAFSDEAVAKIYAIKGRQENKPIHCIVSDLEAAAQFADVNDAALALSERFLPGALTLVLKKRSEAVSGIAKNILTIGIRIPDNDLCLRLASAFGPYTTTSANISGIRNERSVEAILAQLGERASMIDLVIDAGELPERKPSTVVDVSSGATEILREGAIWASEILEK